MKGYFSSTPIKKVGSFKKVDGNIRGKEKRKDNSQ